VIAAVLPPTPNKEKPRPKKGKWQGREGVMAKGRGDTIRMQERQDTCLTGGIRRELSVANVPLAKRKTGRVGEWAEFLRVIATREKAKNKRENRTQRK